MARAGYAATLDMWGGSFGAATGTEIAPRPRPAAAATTTTREAKGVSIYIRGTTILPGWFEDARNALAAIAGLPAGWNSYSSRELHADAVATAVQVLLDIMGENSPLPTFVPVPNGGVLLEWHTTKADFEIEAMPSGRVHYAFDRVGAAAPEEDEGLPQELVTALRARLSKL